MSQSRMAGSALIAVLALAGATMSAGCGRDAGDDVTPVAQGQTERAIENLARDVTVLGCLRAGEAANTFVVTASEAGPEGTTRTYALSYPADQPEDLQEHVGGQVEVQGIVRAQHAVTGATPSTPPANEPVGTGGEPRVQTTTTLAVEQLEVRTLRPLGEACAER